jgi:potassium/chloride transporter 4/5/6
MQTVREFYYKIGAGEKKKEGIGTFLGVYLPSLFTMIGALLYLPLGTTLGNFGLLKTLLVLSFSLVLTLITALSLSSTASNMHVGDGGSYFMISRSFGLKTGAVMGFALYIAHTLMACLCVLGFTESIHPYISFVHPSVISTSTLLFIAILSFSSTNVAIKAQAFVLALVLFSFVYFFFGSYKEPLNELPTYPPNFSFWSVFAVLYPAIIGIEAGAALSGDLKKPSFSLIVGTLTATVSGFVFYLVISLVLWKNVPQVCLRADADSIKNFMQTPIALVGFWAASLASALGCFLSAPRTLKAMASDGVFPKWFEVFASKDEENVRIATLFTTCLAFSCSYFGSIDVVMPLLTIVILIVYGLLNLASGVEEFISNPSWRPRIRVSPYLSFLGAFLCFMSIILMDSSKAFIASVCLVGIYYVVKKTVIDSRLDDLRQTVLFSVVRFAIYRLAFSKPSLRSWRPNFLVLSESASGQSSLLNFTSSMAKGRGFVTLASVLKNKFADVDEIAKWEDLIRQNLKKRSLEALVEVTIADDIALGLKNIISNYGLGPLVPNTVVVGQCTRGEHLENYLQVLKIAEESKRNILIFRSELDLKALDKLQIDIWWDNKQKQNAELMIILANLLVRQKQWSNAKITLKSFVPNEAARIQQTAYFDEFFQKSRFDMSSEIYIEQEGVEIRQMIPGYSTKKGIVFVGMKESSEEYYKKLIHDFKSIPNICFVTNHQEIDLHNLLI